jgi:hypothetical protein
LSRITSLMTGTFALALAALAAGSASATAAGTLPTFAVTMTGNSISVPSTVAAGAVNVVSSVSGEAAGSPTLVRLQPGVTPAQAFDAVQSHGGDPNALQGLASVVFNVQANQGTSSAQTLLTPGNWVALDTTKNNPNKWPFTTFTVTANSAPASLPAAGATVETQEFRFLTPSRLHSGEVVRFVNGGYLVHMVIGFRVKNMAAAKAVVALLRAGKDKEANKFIVGPPPGWVGTFSPGAIRTCPPRGARAARRTPLCVQRGPRDTRSAIRSDHCARARRRPRQARLSQRGASGAKASPTVASR